MAEFHEAGGKRGEGGREGSGGWFFERNDFNSSSRLKRKGEHGLLLGDARWILEITNNSFLSLEDFLFFAPLKSFYRDYAREEI